MAKTITPDEFAKEVVEMMKKYTTDVEEGISEVVKKVGDEGAYDLQDTFLPSGSGGTAEPSQRRPWEMYAQSWTNKFEERTNYSSSTIHNKKHYQLAHLLEYGHATRDGKRTRAFPHIKPVSDKREKELLDKTIKVIEKGGKL